MHKTLTELTSVTNSGSTSNRNLLALMATYLLTNFGGVSGNQALKVHNKVNV